MHHPTFIARDMTADGRHVVAWSTGAISPSRLVANYPRAHKGPKRHHDADAKAAAQLVDLAPGADLADIIAAIPTVRHLWRNHAAGGDAPTTAQTIAVLMQCRSFRLTQDASVMARKSLHS